MADRVIVDFSSNIGNIIAEQEKYISTLKNTDTELKNVNKTASNSQKELEDSIKRQQQAVKDLNKQIADTAPGAAQRDLIRTRNEVNSSMQIQQGKLKALNAEYSKQSGILEVLRKRSQDLAKAREKADDPKRIEKINGLLKKNDDRIKDLTKSGESQSGVFDNLSGIFKKVGVAAAAAFATKKIIEFGKEALDLAIKAEGIQNAFDKLNQPDLLDDLRKATKGTINDVELMQAAVRAENFKVPLEQLGTFFEFATRRAKDTGQSVDYLVNSIVDGIGRKSSLVLDNLGISATELQDEIKKTGDFGEAAGNIISRSLKAAGEDTDTTSEAVARINARFENFKLAVGNILMTIADPFINFLDAVTAGFDHVDDSAQRAKASIQLTADEMNRLIDTQKVFNETMPTGFDDQAAAAKAAGLSLVDYQEKVGQTQDAILSADLKLVADDFISNKAPEKITTTLNKLKEELKLYQEALGEAVLGSKEFTQAQLDIANTQAKIDEALGKTKEVSKDYAEVQKEIAKGVVENNDLEIEALNKTLYEFNKAEEEKAEARKEALEQEKEAREFADETLDRYTADNEAAIESERRRKELTIQLRQETYTAISGLFGALAELGAKGAKFTKALTLFQIGADSARAISGVTAAALSKGALGVPEFLAIGAIIASSIARAKATLAQQPAPEAAFKDGVIGYKGKGTDTSDSNVVRISRNESVIKAKSTKKHRDLLTAINKDDGSLSDIIMNNYLPKNFSESLGESLILNMRTDKLESLMGENTKASIKNTQYLASVIDSNNKEISKYSYVQRKQSKI